MSKIKGQNLRVFLGEAVIAEATNCVITLTNNMEDGSTKDTTGMFGEDVIATKSWQVQVDTLNVSNLATFLNYWKNASLLSIQWDQTADDNTSHTTGWSGFASGSAYLTDMSMQFNDRQNVATNITFTGSGEISLETDE